MRCTFVQNYRNKGIPRTLFHFANNLKYNCDTTGDEPREMNTELEKNYRVMLDIKVNK